MAGQYASAGDDANDDEIRNEGSDDDEDDGGWSGCGKICSASKRARGCGGTKDDNDDGTDEDEDDDEDKDEDNDAVAAVVADGGNGAVCVRCRMKSAAMYSASSSTPISSKCSSSQHAVGSSHG